MSYIEDQDVPVGSVVLARWAFTTVGLNPGDINRLVIGDALPTNYVGIAPTLVLIDIQAPGAAVITYQGGAITTEATVGVYNYSFAVTAAGIWRWRGYGQSDGGGALGATFWHQFTAS
jgi:hypothetical protein